MNLILFGFIFMVFAIVIIVLPGNMPGAWSSWQYTNYIYIALFLLLMGFMYYTIEERN